jgi:hypothetical protein
MKRFFGDAIFRATNKIQWPKNDVRCHFGNVMHNSRQWRVLARERWHVAKSHRAATNFVQLTNRRYLHRIWPKKVNQSGSNSAAIVAN